MLPKSFKLFGHKVTVHIVPEADWPDNNCVGLYQPHKHRILIRGGLSDSLTLHTFYHELTHAIAGALDFDWNDDEKTVDTFSALLHQAMTTAKF